MEHIIGAPVVRADARVKVTGAARYAADVAHPGTLHAALATSAVARGRIRAVDSAAAEAVPGVRLVLTHRNMAGALAEGGFLGTGGRFQSSFDPLSSPEVKYHGQIVGLAVADTLEAAEEAARRLRFDYAKEPAAAGLEDTAGAASDIEALAVDIGDAEDGLRRAAAVVDAEYRTASMHHNPIELYATTARWQGDELHAAIPSQWVVGTRAGLAAALRMPAEKVHVESPYVGGAFGSKASVLWHSAHVAIAAKCLGRPVKLVVSRQQMFTVGSYRPETLQRVRLGADPDGRLLAYAHDATTLTARHDVNALPGTHYTRHLYAAPAMRLRERLAPSDLNNAGWMRAPLEFHASFAQESAMDELAAALGLDPIDLRVRNEPEKDPATGLPFSSRGLVPCLRRGSELFGWSRRDPRPGSMRSADGHLLGWGVAAAWYPVYRAACMARVELTADGRARVEIGASDLGTGAYTVLKQVAAEDLGLPPAAVDVVLGSSGLPVGPMAAGSSTSASAGSAVRLAARDLLNKLFALATAPGAPLAGRDVSALRLVHGRVVTPDGVGAALPALLAGRPRRALAADALYVPREMNPEDAGKGLGGLLKQAGPVGDTHVMFAYGAQFAEVRVDPLTRRVRLGRLVGVFAGGRILNPRTARSQLIGGMIWGASHALMEETALDRHRARFANADLAGYHFAVNADVGDVVVEMLDEADEVVNPLGVKGLGEIGVVGVAAAIANAVHHATSVRVRKTPILVDDLLGNRPA